ncbi:hypothetical protein SDRG_06652 [Saprolegnia diclina VS20]|uniref:Myosin-like protein n=1 Tax=Saprolegnia diclina (strain VS20) TaxID=1156394 RepID=T0QDE4_SAPDV|nr:hypothetical protein SDRG_06652 [Saprolegnia diclina VS20]EQC35904.1 hypothetical protein SDRG_06652 [Saprolegnia diclina VS20]|eukprot:XP_008610666.1 hypothetical protein SDRG_06652 [Saprolegnia diclina VS20]
MVRLDDGSVLPLLQLERDMDVCRGNASSSVDLEDLGMLTHLNEPSMVHCLEERFMVDKVYCHTGEMLLAVNPFKTIPRLYDVDAYRATLHASMHKVPHVFTTAHDTYQALHTTNPATNTHMNQTVLVSGESGSGKTESTKFIMQYLAVVSKVDASSSHNSIADQVLQSNPILESFGNARTLRNDNSSRFGKFVKIWFAPQKHDTLRLIGTTIETYLLEKVRLVHQAHGERNFHIFYELLAAAAANPLLRASLHLEAPVTAYAYLGGSGCYVRQDNVRDEDEFQKTMRAMAIVGFEEHEKASILEIVASLLHLGNMVFGLQPGGGSGGSDATMSDVASFQELHYVSSLLAVEPDRLRSALTKRQIKAKDEWYVVQLTVAQAEEARDAMARSIYGYLFDWIVAKVNTCIGGREFAATDRFIGVLDIFGFESFDVNSFEQLCINYANERLQHHFIDFVLTQEQKRYMAEGIPWATLTVPLNDGCLDILEARPTGVLALLDEECNIPKGSDAGLTRKLYQIYSNHGHFSASRRDQVELAFVIKHYAGAVRYDARGFCEKNRDKPHQEIFDLLSSSSNAFIALLCRPVDVLVENAANLPTLRRKSSLVSMGLGSQFRKQLHQLLEMIALTQPHYIRCLKPNDANKKELFQRQRMADQLRYGGVLEAVRIARLGYSVHMKHAQFVDRYRRVVAAQNALSLDTLIQTLTTTMVATWPYRSDADASASTSALYRLGLEKGKTLVFLRQSTYDFLELAVGRRLKASTTRVQAFARMALQRSRFWTAQRSVHTLQRVARGFLARCVCRRLRSQRRLALYLQAWYRGRQERIAWQCCKERRASLRIQRQWRRHAAQQTYRCTRRDVVRVQCRWRVRMACRALQRRKADAMSLQHTIQERNELRQRLVATLNEADIAKRRAAEAERQLQEMKALVQAMQNGGHQLEPVGSNVSPVSVEVPHQEAAVVVVPPTTINAPYTLEHTHQKAPTDEHPSVLIPTAPEATLPPSAMRISPTAFPATDAVGERTVVVCTEHLAAPDVGRREAPSERLVNRRSDVAPVETSLLRDVVESHVYVPRRPLSAVVKELDAQHRVMATVATNFVAACIGQASHATAAPPQATAAAPLLPHVVVEGTHLLSQEGATNVDLMPLPAHSTVAVPPRTEHSALPAGQTSRPPSPLLEHHTPYQTWTTASLATLSEALAQGQDPDAQDAAGRTLLHVAVETGNAEMVDLLLQHKASVVLADFAAQETPYHVAAKLANMEISGIFCRPDIYPQLDVNLPDKEGNTVLHLAAMSPRPTAAYVLELYLCMGADPNAQNVLGRTPLHVCALHRRDATLIERLVSFGADPNVYAIDRKMPLHIAAKRGLVDACIELVKGGASMTLRDGNYECVVTSELANQLRPHVRHPPHLVPDADADACMLCAYPFNFLVRRHHCRVCGILGCSDCVSNKRCVACVAAAESK